MASMLYSMISTQMNPIAVYDYHLKYAIEAIRKHMTAGNEGFVHKVITSMPGYFVTDTQRCAEYIIVNLIAAGFEVEYLGDNNFYISWLRVVIKEATSGNRSATAPVKSKPIRPVTASSTPLKSILRSNGQPSGARARILKDLKVRFDLPSVH